MENGIIKIDTNDLRTNLTKYLKNEKGATIYITRYNELIAELKIYNLEKKLMTELKIAKGKLNEQERREEDIFDFREVV